MHEHPVENSRTIPRSHPLFGKKTYVPRMVEGTARALAAVLRSLGVDADVTPHSNARTLDLGAKFSSGDECYPLKVTLGDFLQITEQPGFDPKKTAFFMVTGHGPCRFGQYAPYLRSVLTQTGYSDVTIFQPTTEKGYSDFGESSTLFTRGVWRAIVAADILLKLLLKSRPYEVAPGSADASFEESLQALCKVLEVTYDSYDKQMVALCGCLLAARERFRKLPVQFDAGKPLIGVVGEIFCRLNEFSNNELVRRLESAGAEVWMNDFSEWIWYTNADQHRRLQIFGRRFSMESAQAHVRNYIQRKDEHILLAMFKEDFRGYEEPHEIQVVLDGAEPYLPALGANGEMVVNVGKAVYFAHKGLDGVIDISPFTCMNGIVGEAVYPRISRDHAGIPIRNFYFDGTNSDLDRDIGIFLELARSYQRHKPWRRELPVIAKAATP
jgi:predicted nucleotide-binding protein (sugar kinase/HSP70/actin superfamily)